MRRRQSQDCNFIGSVAVPVVARQGLVTPDPSKRPKSSYIRFAAEQPNECRQADFTHCPLPDGQDTEILT